MPWWGWILMAAALLGAELAISTEFYLVFVGLAALGVGLLALAGLSGPAWLQWLIFGGLGALFLLSFRRRLVDRLGRSVGSTQPLVGEVAVAREAIEGGSTGQAELRGSVWTARNTTARALGAGQRARVVWVEGLVLHVEPEEEPL